MLSKSVLTFASVLFCAVAFGASAADTPSGTAPGAVKAAVPWEQAFAAFADEDASHPHPAGGVLFVGSSSIRLWSDLQDQFKDLPVVINRGFGGSRTRGLREEPQSARHPLPSQHRPRLRGRQRPRRGHDAAGSAASVHRVRRGGPSRAAGNADCVHIDQAEPAAHRPVAADPQTNALIRDYTEGLEKVGVHRRVHADARHRGQATHRAVPRRFAAPQRRRLRALEARHRTPRALTSAAAFGRAELSTISPASLLPPSVARAIP